MKAITIRLPDVEAAMLDEVAKTNKSFKDIQGVVIRLIRNEYSKRSQHG
jgi:hypothetical protein